MKKPYIDNKFKITVGFNEEMKEKIEKFCADHQWNYNQLLREAVKYYLHTQDITQQRY